MRPSLSSAAARIARWRTIEGYGCTGSSMAMRWL